MVDRNRTNSLGITGKKKDPDAPSRLLSSKRSPSTDKQDELITSLAERYENRRARQVGEWEMLYGENVYRAF